MDTQDTSSENEVSLQKVVNGGQERINFELNEVNKDVIEALNVIVQMLKAVRALPPLTHDLKEIDFNKIEKALSDAYDRSKKVAAIRPPGVREIERDRQPKSLVKFFAESPLTNVELDLSRDSDIGREINL